MPEPPIAIDLCCGLGGWTAGLLAEGYRVIGFDIERPKTFPSGALFVQQDVATLSGQQFRGRVALIVASPPCTEFSQLWRFAKQRKPNPELGLKLVRHCFRIAREYGGPFIVENVQGARPFFEPEFGPPAWHVGPYYFWGGGPVLRPGGRFMKGVWNTNPHVTARGVKVSTRRGKAYVRCPAQRALIPIEIARAVANQAKVGAWWS